MKKRAFTFVELLLVVTLFAILSLAVYATFASGMRLWRRIQDTSLAQRKVSLGLEKFSLELRQALDFPKIDFSGKNNEVSFPLLWEEDIFRITYFLEQKSLFRKEENFKDILEENEESKIKSIVSDIEDLKFSFAYQEEGKKEYFWKDTRNKEEESLPTMVKIELKTKDANFTKTVTIPAL